MDEQRPEQNILRAILSSDEVRVGTESVRVGAPRPGGVRNEPTIQLVREDGVIRAIDVVCSCGERIRVRCDYE